MIFAYIDPGTGSFLLQVLLAGVLGGLATLKFYWGRVRAFFSRGGESAEAETGN